MISNLQTNRILRKFSAGAILFRSYIAKNEKIVQYAQGSKERAQLDDSISRMTLNSPFMVPICIGQDELESRDVVPHHIPFDRKQKFVEYYSANEGQLRLAVDSCLKARETWSRTPFNSRADIFLKAADLVTNKYRYDLLAATILGQAKTIFQAEIDAVVELADFLRFNVQFADAALHCQPISTLECQNRVIYRPNEGFWAALPPFNFTAIAGNLASAPALMGNCVIWKPSPAAIYSNYLVFKILLEAGLPPGVINFVPCDGPLFGHFISREATLAGINFTGSTKTYRTILKSIAENLDNFRTYPRTIGECGGKNYHFVHPSADLDAVALATMRSSFEYSGQKCSACSRLYVPSSVWPKLRALLVDLHSQMKIGSPLEKETFTSAVIDELAFKKIAAYIDYSLSSCDVKLVAGGTYDKSSGFYIQPSIFETRDPRNKIMQDDIFGPFLAVYVYDDKQIDEALNLVNTTSDYGLTGSVFAQDMDFITRFTDQMIDSVGNMYINAPSTGSVVGNQPFGGARLSGTNDKAGGPHYIIRFTSPLSIKTQLQPISSWKQVHTL